MILVRSHLLQKVIFPPFPYRCLIVNQLLQGMSQAIELLVLLFVFRRLLCILWLCLCLSTARIGCCSRLCVAIDCRAIFFFNGFRLALNKTRCKWLYFQLTYLIVVYLPVSFCSYHVSLQTPYPHHRVCGNVSWFLMLAVYLRFPQTALHFHS